MEKGWSPGVKPMKDDSHKDIAKKGLRDTIIGGGSMIAATEAIGKVESNGETLEIGLVTNFLASPDLEHFMVLFIALGPVVYRLGRKLWENANAA